MELQFAILVVAILCALTAGRLAFAAAGGARRNFIADKNDQTDHRLLREAQTGQVDIAAFCRGDAMEPIRANQYRPLRSGKRIFDVVAGLGLLVFFAPLLALTAIVIRIDSPGPVLYRQRRVGLNGRIFKIYKFRSMVVDAEKSGAQWASKQDPRVTRVGRFIRKTRIDEIPQALNVLKGEMSFVGPRPERPEFVEQLENAIPNYHLRHLVKPGITGWAQVKYVYGASIEDACEKLKYDLYYIKHYGLWRDFLITLLTIRVALFGIGSR